MKILISILAAIAVGVASAQYDPYKIDYEPQWTRPVDYAYHYPKPLYPHSYTRAVAHTGLAFPYFAWSHLPVPYSYSVRPNTNSQSVATTYTDAHSIPSAPIASQGSNQEFTYFKPTTTSTTSSTYLLPTTTTTTERPTSSSSLPSSFEYVIIPPYHIVPKQITITSTTQSSTHLPSTSTTTKRPTQVPSTSTTTKRPIQVTSTTTTTQHPIQVPSTTETFSSTHKPSTTTTTTTTTTTLPSTTDAPSKSYVPPQIYLQTKGNVDSLLPPTETHVSQTHASPVTTTTPSSTHKPLPLPTFSTVSQTNPPTTTTEEPIPHQSKVRQPVNPDLWKLWNHNSDLPTEYKYDYDEENLASSTEVSQTNPPTTTTGEPIPHQSKVRQPANRYHSTYWNQNSDLPTVYNYAYDEENLASSTERPDSYIYGYKVNQGRTDYGLKESRKSGLTRGQYFVELPDCRRMIVDYEADTEGFRPVITYDNIPDCVIVESSTASKMRT
ncbi:uncharacterized protein PB18E9.04c-like [Trichogramma pretiosum]|uniref:uncharacterized protein PB18E9.04c-like n=1 Tax=Trichogramma pretiosum TaxID=7493 RepID=UPI0006C9460F|nr:uncharacterized protein PB18E9.04c-like [Trichogramma pretiosum]